jgi:hypothetical protein
MPAPRVHFVRGNLWDRRFRKLSPHAKIVAFYVYTAPTRVSEGIFELSTAHVVADTGLQAITVEKAFLELSEAGLIDYDDDNEVVLDYEALRTNPRRNGRDKKTGEIIPDGRIAPAVKLFEIIPDSELKHAFMKLAKDYSPVLAAAIHEDTDYTPPSEGAEGGPLPGARGGANRTEANRRDHEEEQEPNRSDVSQLDSRGTTDLDLAEKCSKCGRPTLRSFNGSPTCDGCWDEAVAW